MYKLGGQVFWQSKMAYASGGPKAGVGKMWL